MEEKGKILIIDDNEDVLFALNLLLEPYMEQIRVTTQPTRIEHFMTTFHPDVILLDMNFQRDAISGQEGFDYLKQILRIDPQAVVVFMTAYADTGKAVQAIKAGATDFISKPWEKEKLLATLSAAVKLSRSRQEVGRLQNEVQALKGDDRIPELIASKTCELFFALASAQSDLEIARANYASADTLYRYARGRYRIGSITENEMLQLEVNKLTEETNLMKARISVEDAMLTFRSFLGIREEEEIEVVPHDSVPDFEVPLDKALEQAHFHSPEIETYRRMQLESRSQLASARASRGLKADLYLQFGLSQTAARLRDSYRDPLDQQYVSLSVVIPILDWGRGKGKVRVAKSNIELVNTQVEQGMNDFELNVRQMVRQFNLQARQVEVASRTDETARRRYEVALRLYLMGKSSVLDLNAATTEKDTSRRNYIEALKTYWMLYYGLRSLTQYDFYRNCPLTETLPEI
jgi:FixJ family two-component response regulator